MTASRVATGYGQPAITTYDWTLAPTRRDEDGIRPPSFRLPEEMNARLRIEQYVGKVTDLLYTNSSDPVGLADEDQKPAFKKILATGLAELEDSFKNHSDIPGRSRVKSDPSLDSMKLR